MAVKQKYRYNQSEKNYEVFDDFSGGMDTVHADALLKPNVSRDIANFDVKSGGVLQKRKGLHSIEFNSGLVEDGLMTQDELLNLEVIRSFKFIDGAFNVITLYTKFPSVVAGKTSHIFLNLVFRDGVLDKKTRTVIDVDGSEIMLPPIISMNGDKAYLLTKTKVRLTNAIKSSLRYWSHTNWRVPTTGTTTGDVPIKEIVGVHGNPIPTQELVLWQNPGTYIDSTGAEQPLPTLNNNDKWPNSVIYLPTYHLNLVPGVIAPPHDARGTIPGLIHGRDSSDKQPNVAIVRPLAGTTANLGGHEDPNAVPFFTSFIPQQTYEFTKFEIQMTIKYRSLLFSANKDVIGPYSNEGVLDLLHLDPTYFLNPGNKYVNIEDFIQKVMITGKFEAYYELKASTQGGTMFDIFLVIREYDGATNPVMVRALVASKQDAFLSDLWGLPPISELSGVTGDLKISFEGLAKSADLGAFDDISKPNTKTYTLLGYNLLNVLETNKLDSITAANINNFIEVPSTTETTTLLDPIITNKLLPVVGETLKITIPIALKTGEHKADYYFGYRFVPLERWIALETAISTNTEFINQLVKPATWLSKGVNSISITPQTSDQYVLVVYSTKTDPTTVTDVNDILSVRLNINPSDTVQNNLDFKGIKEDFAGTMYSLNYKNQWIIYGGSNKFFVSDVDNFGYFPITNMLQIPFSEDIVNIAPFFDALIVQTESNQYLVKGNTPTDFQLLPLNSGIGTIAHKSVKPNVNYLTHLTLDGVYNTKSAYSFDNRTNLEKIDLQLTQGVVAAGVPADRDACAVISGNRYLLHTPSTGEIWIYYNNFKSWIRHDFPLLGPVVKDDKVDTVLPMQLENMYLVGNRVIYINKTGLFVLQEAHFDPTDARNTYTDIIGGRERTVESTYTSKQLSVGLPDHEKKWKAIHIKFEDTILETDLYVEAWVDGMLRSTHRTHKVVVDPNTFKVTNQDVEAPQITTIPQGRWGNAKWGSQNGNNSKYDADANQLHKVQLSGRGKALEYTLIHKDPKLINITNISLVYKIKKPKPTTKR